MCSLHSCISLQRGNRQTEQTQPKICTDFLENIREKQVMEEKKQRWEVMRQWLNNQTQEMTAAYGASGVSAVMTAFHNDKNTAVSLH